MTNQSCDRQEIVDSVLGTMGAEGEPPSDTARAFMQQYIEGQIPLDKMTASILATPAGWCMKVILFDSQFDEQHGVLRNKLHCKSSAELTRLATDFATARLSEMLLRPVLGNFDISHLRRIHQYIFQDVFPWAGDFREVITSRTGSFGFPPPVYILPSLETLFAQLKNKKYLKALNPRRLRHTRGPLPRRAQRHPPVP